MRFIDTDLSELTFPCELSTLSEQQVQRNQALQTALALRWRRAFLEHVLDHTGHEYDYYASDPPEVYEASPLRVFLKHVELRMHVLQL